MKVGDKVQIKGEWLAIHRPFATEILKNRIYTVVSDVLTRKGIRLEFTTPSGKKERISQDIGSLKLYKKGK